MATIPKWHQLAMMELGTKEAPGYANNPIVQQYYVDAGSGKQPDSVPWCAAFVGAMLKRAGVSPSGYLAARSYLKWGKALTTPVLGAIVVFKRGNSAWQGHVAFFEGFNPNGSLRVLGGNQSDAVTYANYPRGIVLGYRWPLLKGTPK
jgi:uncharacterized protein (TIGR02594 family)